MMPALFDKAYILHLRRYTDSRVILEMLTCQQGLVHAVARMPGKRDRAKFEAFQPLEVEFIGSSDLKTLRHCEQITELSGSSLIGTSLFCGLYINELLQRVLSPGEPFTDLFYYYETTLVRLQNGYKMAEYEAALRRMEFFMLAQLGFALDFSTCCATGLPVSKDNYYRFVAGEGFSVIDSNELRIHETLVPGAHLLAIADDRLEDPDVLRTAKFISRKALVPLLNGKPLKSRELFN